MSTHKLGFGNGTMVDHGDGTASYRAPGAFTTAFRVRISDITGFSVSKSSKALQRTFKVLGNGTDLATVNVNHGVGEKIEAWFRSHPAFGRGSAMAAPPAASNSVADELAKLAQLRDSGVLTDAEFAQQKAKLLG
jgi:hypothetical protein